jgi:ATP adenylyltransferase
MIQKCEYCQIPGAYGNLITETKYWMIYLAPSQRYIGTCVVVLKRHCNELFELKNVEWFDFADIVRKIEFALKKIFNPTLFNWSCFKNSAFRSSNPNPEIHWHFIPRYEDKIKYLGLVFEDPDFGYIPQPIKREIPDKIMNKLLIDIKKNL